MLLVLRQKEHHRPWVTENQRNGKSDSRNWNVHFHRVGKENEDCKRCRHVKKANVQAGRHCVAISEKILDEARSRVSYSIGKFLFSIFVCFPLQHEMNNRDHKFDHGFNNRKVPRIGLVFVSELPLTDPLYLTCVPQSLLKSISACRSS